MFSPQHTAVSFVIGLLPPREALGLALRQLLTFILTHTHRITINYLEIWHPEKEHILLPLHISQHILELSNVTVQKRDVCDLFTWC